MKKSFIAIFLLALVFSGCSVERQYEVYPDLIARVKADSSTGLWLTEANHPHGWGRSDCFRCHVFNNIHIQNNTEGTIDDATLSFARVGGTDTTQCSMCHQDNGVAP